MNIIDLEEVAVFTYTSAPLPLMLYVSQGFNFNFTAAHLPEEFANRQVVTLFILLASISTLSLWQPLYCIHSRCLSDLLPSDRTHFT